jgi:hypothetical protein
LFAYQFIVVTGSIATGPPSPPRISGQSVVVPVALLTPAVPIAHSPAIMVYGVEPACDMLTTSASEPRLPFKF